MLTGRRMLTLPGVLVMGFALSPSAVYADNDVGCGSFVAGGGVACKGTVDVLSGTISGSGSGAPTAGGNASTYPMNPCTVEVFDLANSMVNADRVVSPVTSETMSTGTWYEQTCPDGSTPTISWAGPDAPALPSPESLAQQAISSVTVATPQISLDPFYLLSDGRRATLKNVQTWLWIDAAAWVPLTPRVDVGPVWAQATISPQTIIVNRNDGSGESYSCKGPGTPIPAGTPVDEPSPTCSLQFTEETDGGTWPVSVQVSYSVTWTGFNGSAAVGGTLPDLTSAPVTIPLAVLTAKPELIDPAHD